MVTEELLNFVRAQIASGMKSDEIERLLVGEGGWDKSDVDEAMVSLGLMSPPVSSAPILSPVVSVAPETQEQPASAPEQSSTPATVEAVASEEISDAVTGLAGAESADVSFDVSAQAQESVIEAVEEKEVAASLIPPAQSPVAPTESEAHEDFLGIFADDGSGVVTEAPSSEVVIPASTVSPSFNLANAVEGSEIKQEIIPAQVNPVEPPSLAVSSVSVIPTTNTPAADQNVAAVTTAPSDGLAGVRFDFSSLKKDAVATPASPAGSPVSDPALVLGKPIETKSVADAWLAGARDSKESKDSSVVTPSGSPEVKAKPAVSRTMGSDILLRGVGSVISGVPSLLPTEEPAPKKEEAPAAIAKPAALADDIARKNKIKKILLIAISVIAVIGVITGVAMYFMKTKAPDKTALFEKVSTNFLAATAFGYQGEGKIDFLLSMATPNGVSEGSVKFDLSYGGALQNTKTGFGDGSHRIKLTGGLKSGDFVWSTDIDTDMKVVGDMLYFHVLSLPESTNMDPDVLSTYWVKVNLSDVAKELALQGVAASQEGYGNFGGSAGGSSFNSLLQKSMPFTVGDIAPGEESAQSVLHYKLKVDPDRTRDLISLLMRKYMNKDLILSDEEKIRLKDAFAKISGDVWVNGDTGTIMKLVIAADFDDDMFGMHVKGPMSFVFNFSDFNKAVTVVDPTPILTLEELQARNNDYKKVKEKRAQDQVKLDRLSTIKDALTLYYDEYKKYPATLAQLEKSGKLASSVDTVILKQYLYAAYITEGTFTKSGRCTATSKKCEYYHLGINLDDVTNPVLESDADQTTDVSGADTAGCSGESDVACYDITSSLILDSDVSTENQETATTSVVQ